MPTILPAGMGVEFHWKVVWRGLLVNVVFSLQPFCIFVGWLCERRIIRRGSVLKFTIAETMLAVLVACCAFAWIHRCNRAEELKLANLPKLHAVGRHDSAAYASPRFRQSICRLMARLFDYPERLPLMKGDGLWQVRELFVVVRVGKTEGGPGTNLGQLATKLNAIPYSKYLWFNGIDKLDGFMPFLDKQSIDRAYLRLGVDEISNLTTFESIADRSCVEVEMTIQRGSSLDLAALEHMPKFKSFCVSVTFCEHDTDELQTEWQNEYIKHLMSLNQLDGALFLDLNPAGAECLLGIPPRDKLVAFRFTSDDGVGTSVNKETSTLAANLVEAGYSHNWERTVEMWANQ